MLQNPRRCPNCSMLILDETASICPRCGRHFDAAPPSASTGPASVQPKPPASTGWLVTCPKCHHDNPASNVECSECGATLIGVGLMPFKASDPLPAAALADRERGGCLSAWLILVMVANLAGVAMALEAAPRFSVGYFLALLSIVNIIFAFAMWNWKKWGAVGFGMSMIVVFFLGASSGSIMDILSALIPGFLLLTLVGPKWNLME